jgi:two-component system chemotaxis response regulator CheB
MNTDPIRVLIVDDSLFVRHTLRKHLDADPEIHVVGEASDGLIALEKVQELAPDVITLDVQMPRLDGLETLERLMDARPTPVVMLSALTQRGARVTIQALMRGAVDVVAKPSQALNVQDVMDELIAKVKTAASLSPAQLLPPGARPRPVVARGVPQRFRPGDPLIVIGASTGGPRALQQLLPQFPAEVAAGVVVVQHMPMGFTRALAQRLDRVSALNVQEAADGDRLAHGMALVAPSGYHLRFAGVRKVALDQGPRRNGVRPALDVCLESAAERHGASVIGVVLTGMGRDGLEGARAVKAAGGTVIAEHYTTSVVYGMPRSVVDAGLADHVLPLPQVMPTLLGLVTG